MIEVANRMTIYERNVEETGPTKRPKLLVESHPHRDEMVVLTIAGERVVVSARDLRTAIENATNTNAYG